MTPFKHLKKVLKSVFLKKTRISHKIHHFIHKFRITPRSWILSESKNFTPKTEIRSKLEFHRNFRSPYWSWVFKSILTSTCMFLCGAHQACIPTNHRRPLVSFAYHMEHHLVGHNILFHYDMATCSLIHSSLHILLGSCVYIHPIKKFSKYSLVHLTCDLQKKYRK